MKNEEGRTQNKDQSGKDEERRMQNKSESKNQNQTQSKNNTSQHRHEHEHQQEGEREGEQEQPQPRPHAQRRKARMKTTAPVKHERAAESNDKQGWSKSSTPKRGSMEQTQIKHKTKPSKTYQSKTRITNKTNMK